MSAQDQVVVITGASSGIGEALARAWARRRATVVLAARDEVGLARVARAVQAAGGRAISVPCDVTREEDRARLVDRARAEGGRLDVLVNNAGRGYYGSVAQIDARELEALFALNVIAPLRLAQLALDPLTRSGGAVVMISSVAGVVASPRMGASDDVADQTLRAIDRGVPVVETTSFVRIASAAARLAPGAFRWISAAMAARGTDTE
jgi:short-subunit dehydrogenase